MDESGDQDDQGAGSVGISWDEAMTELRVDTRLYRKALCHDVSREFSHSERNIRETEGRHYSNIRNHADVIRTKQTFVNLFLSSLDIMDRLYFGRSDLSAVGLTCLY